MEIRKKIFSPITLFLFVFTLLLILIIFQLYRDPEIILKPEFLIVIVTICYTLLTYQIIKSNQNIAKVNTDPILWINPSAEGQLYIRKFKKYPAYNLSFSLFIKLDNNKKFEKLAEYKLGTLIDEEETYDIDIERPIIDYLKSLNIKESKFILRYEIKYYTKIDEKPIERAEYIYGHSEEFENNEIALGFSFDKNPSLEGGKSPIKVIKKRKKKNERRIR